MPRYWVRVPVVGEVGVGLDADSEEQAIDLAMDAVGTAITISPSHDRMVIVQCEDLSPVRRITHGNVFMGPLNEVECEDEDEEVES